MQIVRTEIPEVVIIKPKRFEDDRGWFMETFNEKQFHEALITHGLDVPRPFVQDNHSCSKKGVLRGLHYQKAPNAQGKLVRVVSGAAFDVAVDIRNDSPTFGRWVSAELSASNGCMFWIPEGFAHGFVALEDKTHFLYKTTDYYNPSCEASIHWASAGLAIQWPNMEQLLVSEKDSSAPSFEA